MVVATGGMSSVCLNAEMAVSPITNRRGTSAPTLTSDVCVDSVRGKESSVFAVAADTCWATACGGTLETRG